MSDSIILTIDTGLSAVKTALFRTHGALIALDETPNHAVCNQGLVSTMNMAALWPLICTSLHRLLRQCDTPETIVGIGLTGHGNGLYLVTPEEPPGLGITSMDRRAHALAAHWASGRCGQETFAETANHVWAGQPLPLLRHLADSGKLKLAPSTTLLFCKDWVRYALTGLLATDVCEASAAGLIEPLSQTWAESTLAATGLDITTHLPALVSPAAQTGSVSAGAARETGLPPGIPVFGGSIDLALGAWADGLISETSLHVTAGTWSINQQPAASPAGVSNFLQTILAPSGTGCVRVDSSPTSAVNLSLLAALNGDRGLDYDACNTIVANHHPQADDPIFLPFPSGAWDLPDATAGLAQLRLGCSCDQLIATVYDGIALGHLRQIRKFQRHGNIDHILLCGGLSRSPAWSQLLCDYAGVPVSVADNPHSSSWGAALTVLTGLGLPLPLPPNPAKQYQPEADRIDPVRVQRFANLIGEMW